VALTKHIEPRHLAVVFILGVLALILIGLVAREIYYAANADKRPRRRKRRRE
jgi:hypothetical protein